MDAEFAKKWVADLRDPANKQTDSCLFDGEGYCCLGRAEVVAGSTFIYDEKAKNYYITVDSANEDPTRETDDLSPETQLKAGIYNRSGGRRDGQSLYFGSEHGGFMCLAQANDRGVPFSEIADYIEANHEFL